jgi:hypothetical protein
MEYLVRYRYRIGGEVTGTGMKRFVADYLAGQLNRQSTLMCFLKFVPYSLLNKSYRLYF